MSHIDLWNKLEPTDPRHTKEFSGKGGFAGTAINATYILKKLTETFGPCGKGWKFVLEEERIMEGHVLKSTDICRLHVVRGHLSYVLDGTWYDTSPQFGQTFLVAENKYGAFTDEEAPKKSITDCIGKCAVLLGIGADVHLGMFDDSKYVNQRIKEENEAEDATRPAPAPRAPAPPKTPTEDPAKKAAIAFADQSKKVLDQVTLKEQLTAWKSVNLAKVDKVKAYDSDRYDILMLAIASAEARVT